ncbi:hypothetical protein V5799_003956 [Amblyomma americanum]|uniref:Nlr family card domain protein n=1 Tax=Amblyomma americanum TaxID=6943 RepID=A0AAQ4D7H3_AMBAM
MSDLSPELFSSANEAYARLRELKTILSDHGANLKAQCVQDSPHSCELPLQLQRWNRVLGIIGVQLRELTNCGELAVVCSHGIYGTHAKCAIERSVLLFHWLLMSHRCVTVLRMETWGVFDCHMYATVFCDAVAKCTALRNLQFCVQFPGTWTCEQLLDAVQSLPKLEEIICKGFDVTLGYKNMTALAHAIGTKSKLNRLMIEDFCDGPHMPHHTPGMWYIVAALQSNTALSDLSIDVSWMTGEDCRLFSQYIKESTSLKSLRLFSWTSRPALSVSDIAGAVEYSEALVSLQLVRFVMDTSEAWALARSLSSAQKVEQLELVFCLLVSAEQNSVPRSGSEMEGDSRMQPFVHMVRNVQSLRRLRLPLCLSTPEDPMVVFDAFANEAFVEDLRLDYHFYSYAIDSCRVVGESGNGVEMVIDYICSGRSLLKEITECARDVSLFLLVNETAPAVGRFKELLTLHNLSTLTVEVRVRIQAEQAEALAQFLRITESLSKITIKFEAQSTVSMVLLDGLSHNTSITTLIIEGWCTTKRAGHLLADIVCSSKKFRALTYNLYLRSPSRAFFSRLSKYIQNNITLLSVTTGDVAVPAKQLDCIREVLARNGQLLVRAARFVSGHAFDKTGAEALELIGPDPMLVDKVQEMSSVNKKEAADMTRKRLRDLDDMDGFMRAAGVVRDSVICKESLDGRPGLDALPWLCWHHLRQYLRLVDVVEEP